jgi:ATP-dependent helicase/nuclease subunit B
MSAPHPKVYTISHMASFVDTLAQCFVEGDLIPGWPQQTPAYSLSSATIYMPTKRSADSLVKAIKSKFKYKSLFLPNIISIGEITDNENIYSIERSLERLIAKKNLAL